MVIYSVADPCPPKLMISNSTAEKQQKDEREREVNGKENMLKSVACSVPVLQLCHATCLVGFKERCEGEEKCGTTYVFWKAVLERSSSWGNGLRCLRVQEIFGWQRVGGLMLKGPRQEYSKI